MKFYQVTEEDDSCGAGYRHHWFTSRKAAQGKIAEIRKEVRTRWLAPDEDGEVTKDPVPDYLLNSAEIAEIEVPTDKRGLLRFLNLRNVE
jgi:hypothetical protein